MNKDSSQVDPCYPGCIFHIYCPPTSVSKLLLAGKDTKEILVLSAKFGNELCTRWWSLK